MRHYNMTIYVMSLILILSSVYQFNTAN